MMMMMIIINIIIIIIIIILIVGFQKLELHIISYVTNFLKEKIEAKS